MHWCQATSRKDDERRLEEIQRTKLDAGRSANLKWQEEVVQQLKILNQNKSCGRRNAQSNDEAVMEYVKLYVSNEFLNSSKGIGIVAAFSDSTSEDSKLLKEAAAYVLRCDLSDESVSLFLSQFVKVRKNKKEVEQRVGSYIASGMNRAQDGIRDKVIEAFYRTSKDLEINFNTIISLSASKNEKKDSALAAAFSNSITSKENIEAMMNSPLMLDEIPELFTDESKQPTVSIITLGFVLVKVIKSLESHCKYKRKGYRFSHDPYWAKHVLQLHKFLNNQLKAVSLDENHGRENVSWGRFNVRKLLTLHDIADLTKKVLL
ncbi:hypothetical protein FGB62_361g01 [Gracilaria domingensis]|nr:hypothetical protein FGB62_361g01 [Gracilaria domingensis]